MIAIKKEKNEECVLQTDGSVEEITIHPMKHCKDTKSNLLFFINMLSNSWMVSNNNFNNIVMTKDDVVMNMHQCMKTWVGWVCGVEILPADVNYTALDSSVKHKNYANINDFHELLGHPLRQWKGRQQIKWILHSQSNLNLVRHLLLQKWWAKMCQWSLLIILSLLNNISFLY